MKKIVLLLILIFIVFNSSIYAQTPVPTIGININEDISIPVLTCGVAGDTEGRDKCCHTSFKNQCTSPILEYGKTLLHYIPGAERPDEDGDGVPESFVTDNIKKCEKIKKFANDNNNIPCVVGDPSTSDYSNPSCKCSSPTPLDSNQAMINMCSRYLSNNSIEAINCVRCALGDGMWTGMGCLPLDINMLISGFILNTGIGLGGGFALLCIIYAAFMMQSSQGNPEKLKKAQEMITSCIMGLMLIIFSVFIMKLIGVNILRIPGFGG